MATKATDRAVKPAPNKATPPKPTTPQDVKDVERSDSEGMAQPQGLPPHPVPKNDDGRKPQKSRRDRPAKR